MSEQKAGTPYSQNETAKALLEYAKKQFEEKKQRVHFIDGEDDVNELINPLGQYPHAFVLACIMDRQISAENAWRIPKWVKKAFHSFEMETLYKTSLDEFKSVFNSMEKSIGIQIRWRSVFILLFKKSMMTTEMMPAEFGAIPLPAVC